MNVLYEYETLKPIGIFDSVDVALKFAKEDFFQYLNQKFGRTKIDPFTRGDFFDGLDDSFSKMNFLIKNYYVPELFTSSKQLNFSYQIEYIEKNKKIPKSKQILATFY